MTLHISQAQNLEYAFNCPIRIENSKVSKTVKILSEYNRTDIAGENLRKFQRESSLFHCMPSLHVKGYQPDSFSYRFLKVSTIFRHSFRLLF